MFANELALNRALCWVVVAAAVLVTGLLTFIVAPYGRHVRKGWGFEISSRAGWMIMESPSAIGFLIVFLTGPHRFAPVPMALAALWLTHYLHRAYIYPLRLKAGMKPMPAVIAGMAVTFNCINAFVNARWLSALGSYPNSYFADPRFIAGALLFAAGMALNLQSDAILRALRKPGEHGYKIPHGGGFELVSAPNYLGELIEWSGFAIAAWSFPALSFALFTAANLVPRAISNHHWYQKTFPDYPRARRAVIPFVL